jgi:multiple sugar transport system permease protein
MRPRRPQSIARLSGWWFAAPAVTLIAVFFFVPVLASFGLSLTDFDIYALADVHRLRFVGWQNYRELMATPLFWQAFKNTLWFVVVGVPLSLAASLLMALLVTTSWVRFKGLWRSAMFIPVVTTLVGSALVFRYLLHTRYGLINYALHTLGVSVVDWLGDPHYSMPAIIVFAIWKNFGYNMIILIAAIEAIPSELYEAALLDGANAWQRFCFVTVPAIAPTLTFVTILTMAGYFQLFTEPYVMTQGGPAQSTMSVLYLMYDEGFKWWNLGRASAVAFVLFVVTYLVTLLQRRLAPEAEL